MTKNQYLKEITLNTSVFSFLHECARVYHSKVFEKKVLEYLLDTVSIFHLDLKET